MKPTFFQKYLLPGLIIQSVMIAGGYGTGRELVEFFMRFGPRIGLLSIVFVTVPVMSLVAALSFEFARSLRTYDYRTFFIHLLGRGWFLYEGVFFCGLLVTLAVIGAASGTFLRETFGIPYALGVGIMMLAIAALASGGTPAIERVLSVWSLVLYATYAALFTWSFSRFGYAMPATSEDPHAADGWAFSGVRYAALNMVMIPALLFSVRHIETRKEAIRAGLLVGPIAMGPGVFFYLAVLNVYPDLLARPAPVNLLLETLGSRTFQIWFHIVLFGTFIETGAGLVHALNERINGVYQARGVQMHRLLRPATALGALMVATLLSRVGLTGLIATGYGFLSWVALGVYVIPLFTWGVLKIRRVRLEA